jgi:hypothetical protein
MIEAVNICRLVVALSCLWSVQAMACRCVEPGPRDAYARADMIVLATITELAEMAGDVARAKSEVHQSWKSESPKELSILTGEDCRYPFAKGETYLLYVKRGDNGEFGTYICRGNLPEAKAKSRLRWLDRHGARK